MQKACGLESVKVWTPGVHYCCSPQRQLVVETEGISSKECRVQVLIQSHSMCVTLGKSVTLSVPYLGYPKMVENVGSTHLAPRMWGMTMGFANYKALHLASYLNVRHVSHPFLFLWCMLCLPGEA